MSKLTLYAHTAISDFIGPTCPNIKADKKGLMELNEGLKPFERFGFDVKFIDDKTSIQLTKPNKVICFIGTAPDNTVEMENYFTIITDYPHSLPFKFLTAGEIINLLAKEIRL